MRVVLAFDYGERRIGLAIIGGDYSRPTPLAILKNDVGILSLIQEYITKHRPKSLVVGVPKNLDGDETEQSVLCKEFARSLERFKIPVILQDETLSSERAENRLGSHTLRARKKQLDAVAAQIILEDYLRHAKT